MFLMFAGLHKLQRRFICKRIRDPKFSNAKASRVLHRIHNIHTIHKAMRKIGTWISIN